jgi:outer membrane immunogenic protein
MHPSLKRSAVFAAVLWAAASVGANAADITAPVGLVAPVVDRESGFDWNGFYAGVHGGYGAGQGTDDADFLDSLTGGVFGVQAGYNFQADPWLAGFETDFAYSGLKDSAGGATVQQNWLGSTTGRIGFTYDNWLFYGKGGVAYGDVKASSPATGSDDSWALGWIAGAGVEYGFTPKLTGRIEYDHVDLGAKTLFPGTPNAADVGVKSDAVKAGLNYKF